MSHLIFQNYEEGGNKLPKRGLSIKQDIYYLSLFFNIGLPHQNLFKSLTRLRKLLKNVATLNLNTQSVNQSRYFKYSFLSVFNFKFFHKSKANVMSFS